MSVWSSKSLMPLESDTLWLQLKGSSYSWYKCERFQLDLVWQCSPAKMRVSFGNKCYLKTKGLVDFCLLHAVISIRNSAWANDYKHRDREDCPLHLIVNSSNALGDMVWEWLSFKGSNQLIPHIGVLSLHPQLLKSACVGFSEFKKWPHHFWTAVSLASAYHCTQK